ncbi:Protein FRIGIDA-ESSENTIAL 1, partial [Mucuna pruriens]
MSTPDSPVDPDIDSDPSLEEEEEEVEEEIEEEEVEEEEVEEEEEEVEEEVEEEEDEEEVEEEEEEEEVEEEVEEEEEEEEEEEDGEQEVEEMEEEEGEEEDEEEEEEEEEEEDQQPQKENQQQQVGEAVEEKKEEQQPQEAAMEEKEDKTAVPGSSPDADNQEHRKEWRVGVTRNTAEGGGCWSLWIVTIESGVWVGHNSDKIAGNWLEKRWVFINRWESSRTESGCWKRATWQCVKASGAGNWWRDANKGSVGEATACVTCTNKHKGNRKQLQTAVIAAMNHAAPPATARHYDSLPGSRTKTRCNVVIASGIWCCDRAQIGDSSQHMESKGQEKNLGPVSSVAENPEVMPPSSMHCMGENDAMLKKSVSCQTLTLKKEEVHLKYEISSHPKSRENLTSVEDCRSQGLDVDVENAGSLLQKETFGGYSEPGCNSNANLCGDNDLDPRARVTKSSSDTGQDMDIGLLPRDCLVEDANGGQNSRNKTMQSEMESRDDVKQVTLRTRSLSPSAEIKDRNKRPRIVCDFFAKGWCIRGSSCSFLHIKDTVDYTDQEAEADLVTAHQKRELKVEEGVRENVERSRMNEQEASPSWHPSQEKQKFPMRDNLFPENRFAFNASNNYFSPNLSLNSTRADGVATLRNQHMYRGYTSTVLSHSPNSSLVTQFPATSMSLSHRIPAQSGRSLPFSSSLGASNVDSQKLLHTDKEYATSKSTFSGSGREDLALVSSSRIPSYPTGYKSKLRSYNWEPSVPFRPSFFITSMNVSSPGDLYDPLRDSIEIPNLGDGSLKAYLLIHGSNVQASSQVQTYDDSAVVGKHLSNLNDEKSSVSSHNKFCENEPNKSSVPHEKDGLAPETEITSGTYVNYQNGKMGMGQHTFGVADSTKRERNLTEHDARHHGEGSGHKKKRVDRDKKSHEMDVDFLTDGSMQKESKALKFFRAALVEHVKELLKAAWQEGRLSKDAHNMIVKKSVDKVVSTLEPHQISTIDTAKQYVSSSRVKIAKLVNCFKSRITACISRCKFLPPPPPPPPPPPLELH